MKRNISILVTAIITFIALGASAQDATAPAQKGYFAIYGGLSRPIGEFANNDYYDNSAGYAKLGVAYSLNYVRYFSKNWAVSALVSFQDQGRPNSDEVTSLTSGYNTAVNGSSTTTTVTERYQSLNALLGPQYTFTYHDFCFDLGVSAGLFKSMNTPNYQIEAEGKIVSSTTVTTTGYYQNGSYATTFAYGAHLGVRYNVSDGFGFAFLANYTTTKLPITNSDNVTPPMRTVTSQPISVIQPQLGIYFRF